jgi:hypothetical protein
MRELVNLMTGIDQLDEDLIAQMKSAIEFRRRGGDVVTTCCSFDQDPREVWEIPEFQAHCKRLVEFGYLATLISSTTWKYLGAPPYLLNSPFLGAFEVWAYSNDLFLGGKMTMIKDEVTKILWMYQSMVLPTSQQIAERNLVRYPHVPPMPLHIIQI